MNNLEIIDLHFLETKEAIASFMIKTSEGPILIETGPESTFKQLELGVRKSGFELKDIKHVFLTHIHFDHAGAAWKLAKMGAHIYVHPAGAKHLNQPDKLWNSAAQIYGDQMEKLWGKMEGIPSDQLREVKHKEVLTIGDTEITSLHSPGHAVHHIAWKIKNSIFAGDVAGVKIESGPVVPPCPPPDINLDHWKKSILLLQKENPKDIYLTHFGKITDIHSHLDQLKNTLESWADWIKPYFENNTDQKEVIPLFMNFVQQELKNLGCTEELIKVYEYANPSWMSVAGLYRYWKLKTTGRI
ncbi:metallo-beta-lactamase protein [Indibacter alkaliphilus LW1]|jgi:glyoxylase-like metal-dependent hydrolase (beta-lactamase superfamily II)|uniref:Metallo-beta-lactamase protein n=1 Tax=Indibacter alkaliphilus (strain CCUG 57479 / KCTC 22604 / LW1) TaxID=1189612 RepID=S2DUJ3_INDAL|nr:MBL fold metallo-hydrolase [Indibacter alkaliphilus]EOZ95761.1 metallo-beta-lactamase protein [Indibacter alkaliphilus LW1]